MSPRRRLAYALPEAILSTGGLALMLCGDWKAATGAYLAVTWVLSRESAAWERIAKERKR